MRLIGKRPSDKNPNWCGTCFEFMEKHHGGAEIVCTLLFADVRGSTSLAEGIPAGEFRQLMERYYERGRYDCLRERRHRRQVRRRRAGGDVLPAFERRPPCKVRTRRGARAARGDRPCRSGRAVDSRGGNVVALTVGSTVTAR
jgi:hypothetical protein